MTILVTFGTLELKNPEPIKEIDHGVFSNPLRLLSGRTYIRVSTQKRAKLKFRCFTEDQQDIDDLAALVGGAAASLTVGTESYENMKITSLSSGYIDPKGYYRWYEVEFTQHTAG